MKYLSTEDTEIVTSVAPKSGRAGDFALFSRDGLLDVGVSLPWSPTYRQLLVGGYILVSEAGTRDVSFFFSKRTTGSSEEYVIVGSATLPANKRKALISFDNNIVYATIDPSEEIVVAVMVDPLGSGDMPTGLVIQLTSERGT